MRRNGPRNGKISEGTAPQKGFDPIHLARSLPSPGDEHDTSFHIQHSGGTCRIHSGSVFGRLCHCRGAGCDCLRFSRFFFQATKLPEIPNYGCAAPRNGATPTNSSRLDARERCQYHNDDLARGVTKVQEQQTFRPRRLNDCLRKSRLFLMIFAEQPCNSTTC